MVNRRLIELILEEEGDKNLLDLGTGRGEVALRVAPYFRRVVGIDIDEGAIKEAGERCREDGIKNASFYAADAYSGGYRKFGNFQVISASFFMDEEIVANASRALAPSSAFAFACLHRENLKELDYTPRFTFGRGEVEAFLKEHGFGVENLELYSSALRFHSSEEALSYFRPKFAGWSSQKLRALEEYVGRGGRKFTLATLVGKGRYETATNNLVYNLRPRA